MTVALSACGSSGSDAPTTASTLPTSAAPTGTPVKLVVVEPRSGYQASNYTSIDPVAKAWTTYANSQGGVGGHPVQVTTMDTKSDPVTAAGITASLTKDPSVAAVLWTDAATESVGPPKLSAAGVPVVGAIGYDPTIWGKAKNVWEPIMWSPQVTYGVAGADKAAGEKDIYYVACSEVPGCASNVAQTLKAAQALGLKTYGSGGIGVSSSAASYTSQCLDIVDKGVKNLAFGVISQVASRFIKECRQQGYKGSISLIGAGLANPVVDAAKGLTINVALEAFPWFVDAPPVVTYRTVMKGAGIEENQYGLDVSTSLWTSLELFRKALNDNASGLTGTVTHADVIASYGKVKNETLDGLLPQPMTFTADAPQPKVNCFFAITIKDGDLKAVAGGLKPTCLPPSLSAD